MTAALWTLIALAGVLALACGRRRSKYDGMPWRAWWETQRMLRTPAQIAGRMLRIVAGAALLVLATVVAGLLLGTLLAAAAVLAALTAAWWYLRRAARAAAPRLHPIERDDLHVPLTDEPPQPRPPATGLQPRLDAVDDDAADDGDPVMEV